MHIGLVRRGYSPTGGAENYLRRLGVALAEAGHQLTLFTSPDWPPDAWLEDGELIRVSGNGPADFARSLELIEPRRHCDLLFSLERIRDCDCYRAGDGVHRAWLERRARIEPHWRSGLRTWNPKHRQILALENVLYGQRGARVIIANSRLVRDEITAHYPACPPERIEVVYNGLPSHYFAPRAPGLRERSRLSLGLVPDDLALLFAGSGWERKGLACALSAVARLPDAPRPRLLVAGKGNPRPYRRRLDRSGSERVQFLGPVRDMAAIYAAADLFILPTLYDPFSNACLEALAAGLPVLTTRANGFAEILNPGVNGDVFDAGDSDALTDLINRWCDAGRRSDARHACIERAAAFPIEKNVKETLNILKRLTSKTPLSDV